MATVVKLSAIGVVEAWFHMANNLAKRSCVVYDERVIVISRRRIFSDDTSPMSLMHEFLAMPPYKSIGAPLYAIVSRKSM